jgi:hypothetical protein
MSGADPAYPSVMGRYDDADVPEGARLYEIRMLGVPVELFLAARQQHDELMREFAVLALAHQGQSSTDPPELRRLVQELGADSAAAASRPGAEVEAAAEAGEPAVDIVYRMPVSALVAAQRFQELMQRADEFCAQGRMLTMPRSPDILRFASWWFGELRRQVAGEAPTPWKG